MTTKAVVWVRLEFEGPDAEDGAADVVNGLLDVGAFQDDIGEEISRGDLDMKLTSVLEVDPSAIVSAVKCTRDRSWCCVGNRCADCVAEGRS